MRNQPRRKPLRKAADSSRPERRLARAINQGWDILDAGAMAAHAQAQVAKGNVEGFLDALPWQDFTDHLVDTAPAALIDPAQKAAIKEAGAIKTRMSLNHVDDLSLRYAQQQAGTMIVNITNTQRETIRGVLGQAFKGDLTKDQAARQIRRGIGLHPRYAQAVVNFETKQRARPREKGYSEARWEQTIQKRTQTYYDRLLRKRSDLIARTEIITAENLGRYATWSDSIARGVNGVDSLKEWAPGPNACPQICAAMAGEQVRWDQPFSNGSLMPPGHPGCRCVANLIAAPYKNPALKPRKIDWTDPMGNRYEVDTEKYEDGYKLLTTPPKVKKTPAPKPAPAGADDIVQNSTRKISQDQLDEVIDYADAGYRGMNTALRNDTVDDALQARIKRIDDAIGRQADLSDDITVYRGTHVDLADDHDWVGRVFTDKGFTSTTLNKQTADMFNFGWGEQTGHRTLRFEIEVPKGSKGISVQDLKTPGKSRLDDAVEGESEFLLPRGASYRITGERIEDQLNLNGMKIGETRVLTARLENPLDNLKVKPTQADQFTMDSTLHWTEEKLMAQIGKYADTDPEVVDRILDIIDQRAVMQAAQEARDLEQAAAWADDIARMQARQKLNDLEVNQSKAPGAYPKNTDPATNPAARKERKLNSRQINEEEYQQYLGAQMQRAEEELSVMLNNANLQEARAKGVDIYQLFTGPYHVAQKYASEELKEWWQANGRETLGSWRYKAFHRPTDKVHADRVRSLGHESGQARNAREYGL